MPRLSGMPLTDAAVRGRCPARPPPRIAIRGAAGDAGCARSRWTKVQWSFPPWLGIPDPTYSHLTQVSLGPALTGGAFFETRPQLRGGTSFAPYAPMQTCMKV